MNARMCAVLAVLAIAAVAWSQQPPPGGGNDRPSGSRQPPPPGGGNDPASGMGMRPMAGPPRGDVMMESFFPPELVMRHQKEIALTADQQAAIRAEMVKTVGKFTDLQWQQSAEEETLQTLVKQDRPDEKQVLDQIDKVLSIENDLKRAQLGTLVRIKNILTPEQQAKLTELRKRLESRPMPGQPGDRRGDRDANPQGGGRPGPGRGASGPPSDNPPPRGEGE